MSGRRAVFGRGLRPLYRRGMAGMLVGLQNQSSAVWLAAAASHSQPLMEVRSGWRPICELGAEKDPFRIAKVTTLMLIGRGRWGSTAR